jgi:hypothetical protein
VCKLNQVLCRLERAQILVALPNRIVLSATIIAVSHQHGDLCAQLRQLERTCKPCQWCQCQILRLHIHAIAVMVAPAPAPANPKHAIVENVGYAPLVLAMTSGELPVAWYIQSSRAYLERWYMEKETVRTRVMLRRGDQTPMHVIRWSTL